MIYLYVKTHRKTGLKYFGKTTKDPMKYSGSGSRWLKHLKKHGHDVETVVVGSFEDQDDATAFALRFSHDNCIVEDDGWANLMEENALDGAPVGHPGHKFTQTQLEKLAAASKKQWEDPAYRERLSRSQSASWTPERHEAHQRWLAVHWSDERKVAHSQKLSGRPNPNKGKPGKKKPEGFGTKVSAALAGIQRSEEHAENLKLSTNSPASRAKALATRRSKVRFFIGDRPFSSLKHAAEELGISAYAVKKLIHAQQAGIEKKSP